MHEIYKYLHFRKAILIPAFIHESFLLWAELSTQEMRCSMINIILISQSCQAYFYQVCPSQYMFNFIDSFWKVGRFQFVTTFPLD